ncbi:hypothetical protein NPIL_82201 [Nephila pilipes]|uniref:Uncharacterized protein n=1 Tax=Nephila pilipes TaxID=299642 RepID=A0A8X6UTL7_NEPPI|nr:hypothetical protein NPIL_82201 [Nephila pilipes]
MTTNRRKRRIKEYVMYGYYTKQFTLRPLLPRMIRGFRGQEPVNLIISPSSSTYELTQSGESAFIGGNLEVKTTLREKHQNRPPHQPEKQKSTTNPYRTP